MDFFRLLKLCKVEKGFSCFFYEIEGLISVNIVLEVRFFICFVNIKRFFILVEFNRILFGGLCFRLYEGRLLFVFR